MKTMKIKNLLSTFLVVSAASAALVGCSDYDNGYTEQKLKHIADFKEHYGEIDQEQDWNLAEYATVKVTTDKTSNIKIYALSNGEYSLVGDYADVLGERKLGLDLAEGIKQLIVSDGVTAQPATPGGSVNFAGTRTVHTNTNNAAISVQELTGTININGIDYPQYKEIDADDYDHMKEVIPEIGWRSNYTNLNRVTHDFTFVSNGKFVIYPYYWETSSANTIGIYYYDSNGEKQEFDLYKIKEGDELQYLVKTETYVQNIDWSNATGTAVTNNFKTDVSYKNGDGSWKQGSFLYPTLSAFTWNAQSNNMVQNLGLPNGNLLSRFNKIRITATLKKWTPSFRVLFYSSSGTNSLVIKNPSPSADGEQQVTVELNLTDLINQNSGTNWTKITNADWNTVLSNCSSVALAGSFYDGDTQFLGADRWASGDMPVIGDVSIDEMCFIYTGASGSGTWTDYTQNFCSQIFTTYDSELARGKGILVDIPAGTVFGMYLKKTDTYGGVDHPYQFYSEGKYNDVTKVGDGVTDDGLGNVIDRSDINPCYASTFKAMINGKEQMFLGFEDWPNDGHASDFDLNDMVFAFDGTTPIPINEEPKAAQWVLACEDLGGSFDSDFNDMVILVEHVNGRRKATVTPLAAGGTLASYIFFNPTDNDANEQFIGEIHQLFGADIANSGDYTPINVGTSRGKAGKAKTINVDEDWAISNWNTEQDRPQQTRAMGGFYVGVLPYGEEATATIDNSALIPQMSIIANSLRQNPGGYGDRYATEHATYDSGNVPEILCIPYTYVKDNKTYAWAWAQEFKTLAYANQPGAGSYPDFAGWVSDHTTNLDWYKNPGVGTVSELILAEGIDESGGANSGEYTPVTPDGYKAANFGTVAVGAASWYYSTATEQNVTLKAGETMYINVYNYEGNQKFTAFMNDGGTGTTCPSAPNGTTINNALQFAVTGGATSGTATLTLTLPKDDTNKIGGAVIVVHINIVGSGAANDYSTYGTALTPATYQYHPDEWNTNTCNNAISMSDVPSGANTVTFIIKKASSGAGEGAGANICSAYKANADDTYYAISYNYLASTVTAGNPNYLALTLSLNATVSGERTFRDAAQYIWVDNLSSDDLLGVYYK